MKNASHMSFMCPSVSVVVSVCFCILIVWEVCVCLLQRCDTFFQIIMKLYFVTKLVYNMLINALTNTYISNAMTVFTCLEFGLTRLSGNCVNLICFLTGELGNFLRTAVANLKVLKTDLKTMISKFLKYLGVN